MSQKSIKPTVVPPIAPALYCSAYREAMGRHGVLDPEKLFAVVGEEYFKPTYYRVEALIEVLARKGKAALPFTPELIPASATCRLRIRTLKFKLGDLVEEAGKYKQEVVTNA